MVVFKTIRGKTVKKSFLTFKNWVKKFDISEGHKYLCKKSWA